MSSQLLNGVTHAAFMSCAICKLLRTETYGAALLTTPPSHWYPDFAEASWKPANGATPVQILSDLLPKGVLQTFSYTGTKDLSKAGAVVMPMKESLMRVQKLCNNLRPGRWPALLHQ
ncbi:TPA: hypothetical protein ACH3X3_011740 [Trebouxia sp. C0006]